MAAETQRINALRRELGNEFHVVVAPDHPLLLNGPDFLIGGEGKLTAVLLIKSSTNSVNLRARIMGIRLALPSNTKILGVLGEEVKTLPSVLGNIDEITRERTMWRDLARYAAGDAKSKVNQANLFESKRQHTEKYAFAMLLATLRRKHDLIATEPAIVIDGLRGSAEKIETPTADLKVRRQTAKLGGTNVTSLTSRSKPVQQLRSLCESSLAGSYELDTGVPYQKPDSLLGILLVHDFPTIRHDPEKPMRTAAFGGWIMARSTSANDISNLIEKSKNPKFRNKWVQVHA